LQVRTFWWGHTNRADRTLHIENCSIKINYKLKTGTISIDILIHIQIQMCILCSGKNMEQVEGSVLDPILDGYIDIDNQNNISFTILQNHLKFVLDRP